MAPQAPAGPQAPRDYAAEARSLAKQPLPPPNATYTYAGQHVRVPEWPLQPKEASKQISAHLQATIRAELGPNPQLRKPNDVQGMYLQDATGSGLCIVGRHLMLRVMCRVLALRASNSEAYKEVLATSKWLRVEDCPWWMAFLWAAVAKEVVALENADRQTAPTAQMQPPGLTPAIHNPPGAPSTSLAGRQTDADTSTPSGGTAAQTHHQPAPRQEAQPPRGPTHSDDSSDSHQHATLVQALPLPPAVAPAPASVPSARVPGPGQEFSFRGQRVQVPDSWPTKQVRNSQRMPPDLSIIIRETVGEGAVSVWHDGHQGRYLKLPGVQGLADDGKLILLEVKASVQALRTKEPEAYKQIREQSAWLWSSTWAGQLWTKVQNMITVMKREEATLGRGSAGGAGSGPEPQGGHSDGGSDSDSEDGEQEDPRLCLRVFEHAGQKVQVPQTWPHKKGKSKEPCSPHLASIIQQVLGESPRLTRKAGHEGRYLQLSARGPLPSSGKIILLEVLCKVLALKAKDRKKYKEVCERHPWLTTDRKDVWGKLWGKIYCQALALQKAADQSESDDSDGDDSDSSAPPSPRQNQVQNHVGTIAADVKTREQRGGAQLKEFVKQQLIKQRQQQAGSGSVGGDSTEDGSGSAHVPGAPAGSRPSAPGGGSDPAAVLPPELSTTSAMNFAVGQTAAAPAPGVRLAHNSSPACMLPLGGATVYECEGQQVRVPTEWPVEPRCAHGNQPMSPRLREVVLPLLPAGMVCRGLAGSAQPCLTREGAQGLTDQAKHLTLTIMATIMGLKARNAKVHEEILEDHPWMHHEHPSWVGRLWGLLQDLLPDTQHPPATSVAAATHTTNPFLAAPGPGQFGGSPPTFPAKRSGGATDLGSRDPVSGGKRPCVDVTAPTLPASALALPSTILWAAPGQQQSAATPQPSPTFWGSQPQGIVPATQPVAWQNPITNPPPPTHWSAAPSQPHMPVSAGIAMQLPPQLATAIPSVQGTVFLPPPPLAPPQTSQLPALPQVPSSAPPVHSTGLAWPPQPTTGAHSSLSQVPLAPVADAGSAPGSVGTTRAAWPPLSVPPATQPGSGTSAPQLVLPTAGPPLSAVIHRPPSQLQPLSSPPVLPDTVPQHVAHSSQQQPQPWPQPSLPQLAPQPSVGSAVQGAQPGTAGGTFCQVPLLESWTTAVKLGLYRAVTGLERTAPATYAALPKPGQQRALHGLITTLKASPPETLRGWLLSALSSFLINLGSGSAMAGLGPAAADDPAALVQRMTGVVKAWSAQQTSLDAELQGKLDVGAAILLMCVAENQGAVQCSDAGTESQRRTEQAFVQVLMCVGLHQV